MRGPEYMKSSSVFAIFFFITQVTCLSAQSLSSDRRWYDPSWLPPPVGVTGEKTTSAVEAEKSSSALATADKDETSKTRFTSIKELRNLLNSRLLESFVYPVQAKERHIEGSVNLLLTISENGELVSWKQRENPPAILLQAAVRQVISVFPLPVKLEKPLSGFAVSITYTLN